ncbi:MAG: hypothetical protein BGO89_03445 [Candidatus Kapaibacterium thiocyanatum]|uniref:Uncharacterized protein n=1 Tax=Candidatus Kapaibacterium thiocyanatum TaxID=1895771 RepID=A0A1M3L1K4_9BACT|nr:MAG: hypothetical protein BGO89_03445 ['Candidatus Kapabacteria' thiocyanatum]
MSTRWCYGIVVLIGLLVSACGGTHGHVGQYWVPGTTDEIYDTLHDIAADSASGVSLVDNEDYGLKPYLRVTILTPGYSIKGVTLRVSTPLERDGARGCLVSIVDVRRKDGVNCHSGDCAAKEVEEGKKAAEAFLMGPLRRSFRVDLID